MSEPDFRTQAAAYRASTGLSMEAWAKKLGVNIGTVSRWESGEYKPYPAYRRVMLLLMEQVAQQCAVERKG